MPPDPAELLARARRLPLHRRAGLLAALPELLTYDQAGEALARSRSTVCRLVAGGRLAHNGRPRGSHAKRVSRDSVLALLAEQAARAAERDERRRAEQARIDAMPGGERPITRAQVDAWAREAGIDPETLRRPRRRRLQLP